MTLTIGDHLIIKREGKIVEGEAYHEFKVIYVEQFLMPPTGKFPPAKPLYQVKLELIK